MAPTPAPGARNPRCEFAANEAMAARAAARLDARMARPVRRPAPMLPSTRRALLGVAALVAGCACFGTALAGASGVASFAGIACIFAALGALAD